MLTLRNPNAFPSKRRSSAMHAAITRQIMPERFFNPMASNPQKKNFSDVRWPVSGLVYRGYCPTERRMLTTPSDSDAFPSRRWHIPNCAPIIIVLIGELEKCVAFTRARKTIFLIWRSLGRIDSTELTRPPLTHHHQSVVVESSDSGKALV